MKGISFRIHFLQLCPSVINSHSNQWKFKFILSLSRPLFFLLHLQHPNRTVSHSVQLSVFNLHHAIAVNLYAARHPQLKQCDLWINEAYEMKGKKCNPCVTIACVIYSGGPSAYFFKRGPFLSSFQTIWPLNNQVQL